MSIEIGPIGLTALNMRARMPFRYGMATMTAMPHLFVRLELRVDGETAVGLAAEHLAPKWFTKDPNTTYEADLVDMQRVIRSACALAQSAGPAETPFALWRRFYDAQMRWAAEQSYPPLLAGFGASLVERAMIHAFCRVTDVSFSEALRGDRLGFRPDQIHPELTGIAPTDLLPTAPRKSIRVRHVIGMADPLTDDEIPAAERLNDDLPQSLEAAIQTYGLTHFKIKLCGDPERDRNRLKRIAAVLAHSATPSYGFTLDANESFFEIAPLIALWRSLADDPTMAPFLEHLIFLEQPFHRDVAMSPAVREAFAGWTDRPTTLIDESDDRLGSLPLALECGYSGTSYKNCKGVFKGMANACLIAHRQRLAPEKGLMLSGEDLTNVGPVALTQDLAMMANLGIEHVERNGHHYFRGLSMLPPDVQEATLAAHPDLYTRHPAGYPTLAIHEGHVSTESVVRAPFGIGFDFDPSRFTPLDDWRFDSL